MRQKVKVKVAQDQRLVVISRSIGQGINIAGLGEITISRLEDGSATLLIVVPKDTAVSKVNHKPNPVVQHVA